MRVSASMPSHNNDDGTIPILPSHVHSDIQDGKVAIIPNFIPESEIALLRADAQDLWNQQKFLLTEGHPGYGVADFDPNLDRAQLVDEVWRRKELGDFHARLRLLKLMGSVRNELANSLDRPNLNRGYAGSLCGYGCTDITYSRLGPGAGVKRHVDERHEERKGSFGWMDPTRKSLTWVLYINDTNWDGKIHGGQLRCFNRRYEICGRIGASRKGDLQVGWLSKSPNDKYGRPVYMQVDDKGDCRMYIIRGIEEIYISTSFQSNPAFYLDYETDIFLKKKIYNDERAFRDRFYLIEPPKPETVSSPGTEYKGRFDEQILDVEAKGGTLVIFDSVTLPHEVLLTKEKTRWSCNGLFHEDQIL